jgi:hypothetical protein
MRLITLIIALIVLVECGCRQREAVEAPHFASVKSQTTVNQLPDDGARRVCEQLKGDFSPPRFCRVNNSSFSQFGGVPALPEGWRCAAPPYDQDPGYGSCKNPRTGAFDWNYCTIAGIPKGGCNIVHK